MIEDEPEQVERVRAAIAEAAAGPVRLSSEDDLAGAVERMRTLKPHVVLLDVSLADAMGEPPLAHIRAAAPQTAIIVLADAADEMRAQQIVQLGAQDYLRKDDVQPRVLRRIIGYALERQRLLHELEQRMQRIAFEEAQLREILHATADALVMVDGNGVVQYANPAAERLFGRPLNEIINQPFGFPIMGGESTELDIVRSDGTEIVAELQVVSARWNRQPAFVASLRDITERKRSELHAIELMREQLARAQAETNEQRARFLVAATNVMSETLDYTVALTKIAQLCVEYFADWCVIDLVEPNAAVVRVAVAQIDPANEKLARELGELSPEDHPLPCEAQVIRSAEACFVDDWEGEIARLTEARERSVLQRIAPVHGIIVPLCARGRVVGTIALISAESNRRYTQDDRALADELARHVGTSIDNWRLFNEAQRSNLAKSDFLAVMSHELRTPLNAVIGYSDLLLAGVPAHIPFDSQAQVRRIRASAHHLLRLIEEILTYTRLEARREEVALEPIGIGTLVGEVAVLVEPLALDRAVDFRVLPPAPDYAVHTDTGKLTQILVNLLANAVKFTPAGSVTLEVVPVDDWTHFHVRDSGIGIAPEHLEKIFEPFWQAETGRTRRAEGTGLGLSVARRLATLLGGNLIVQSTVGQGSTFTLQVPNAGPPTPFRSETGVLQD